MGLLGLFFPRTAPSAAIAKDRLRLVLAHERVSRSNSPDFLPALRRDLLAAVRKYIDARDDAVEVRLGRSGVASILEISIRTSEQEGRMLGRAT